MQEKKVPSSRISRFMRMSRLTGGIVGGMVAEGSRQLVKGNIPDVRTVLLTPGNAKRLAKQLAAMRGAALKLGQLLSMEAESLLPKELSDILASLRAKAYIMPKSQLEAVIEEQYGENFDSLLSSFDNKPIAAASIGQVHKAQLVSGESIVLKIQYPGVKQSIDSDVENLASLLDKTGLIPDHVALDEMLIEVKRQLHEEADYHREQSYQQRFYNYLLDDPRYKVPRIVPELGRSCVLAMEYVDAEPIESVEFASEVDKNLAVEHLFELLLKELFLWQCVQTDPNFANYQYRKIDRQVVLLDFGACRDFSEGFAESYLALIIAGLNKDSGAILNAAERLGYEIPESKAYQQFLVDIFLLALEPFSYDGEYDFATANITERLMAMSERSKQLREHLHTPPIDVLYFHRKLGGLYLLAMRLKAQVNLNKLLFQYIEYQ